MRTNANPEYKNTDDFNHYMDNAFSDVLNVLKLNIKNKSLRQEAAARALGWGQFGELHFWQKREDNIKHGLHLAQRLSDFRQRDGWTVIAGNIVAVVDKNEGRLLIKALGAGQEYATVTRDNADAVVELIEHCHYNKNAWLKALEEAQRYSDKSAEGYRATVTLPLSENKAVSRAFLAFNRTSEGLIVDLWCEDKVTEEEYVSDTAGVMFDDNNRYEGEHGDVQLYRPKGPLNHPSLDGSHFRWMRVVEREDIHGNACLRIMGIAEDEEHDPSDVIFHDPESAIAYKDEDDLLADEIAEDSNVVLCKITTTVVSPR